jgi:hypothetical protein
MKHRKQPLRVKLARKIDSIFGEAPLDKATLKRFQRNDADVASVQIPSELLT